MKKFETSLQWFLQSNRTLLVAVCYLTMMTTLYSCASTRSFMGMKDKPRSPVAEEVSGKLSENIADASSTPQPSSDDLLNTTKLPAGGSIKRAPLTKTEQPKTAQSKGLDPFAIQQTSGLQPIKNEKQSPAVQTPAVQMIASIGMPTNNSVRGNISQKSAQNNGLHANPYRNVSAQNGFTRDGITGGGFMPGEQCPEMLPAHRLTLETNNWPTISVPRLPANQIGKAASPERIADEYLFDGGDRNQTVLQGKHNITGLNTEDTVAHYRDSQGKRQIRPSNRVAIYSPRFAAVRSISEPTTHQAIQKVAGAVDQIQMARLNTRLVVDTKVQKTQLHGARTRSRLSGLDADATINHVEQTEALKDHVKLTNTFMDVGGTGWKSLHQSDVAKVSTQLQSAITWTRDQNPAIVASDVKGQEYYGLFREEEFTGIKIKAKRPGELKIVKLADKNTAARGDIITFSIQYANVGEKTLTDVSIIDNLTPRLQFIQDSSKHDRQGKLVATPNNQGSVILRWMLLEPLKGGETGTITFQTRVQ